MLGHSDLYEYISPTYVLKAKKGELECCLVRPFSCVGVYVRLRDYKMCLTRNKSDIVSDKSRGRLLSIALNKLPTILSSIKQG
jgi:hypothetical protein